MDKTRGHLVIMGTSTYDTVPSASDNDWIKVVLSTNEIRYEDAIVKKSLQAALEYAIEIGCAEVFIIGGEKLFEEGLLIANRLFLTIIETEIEGDRFFPPINDKLWRIDTSSELFCSVDGLYRYRFTEWVKITS